jgi:hypothetical protein
MSPEAYPRLLTEQPDCEIEQLTRLIERTRAVHDARSPLEARAVTLAAVRRWTATERCLPHDLVQDDDDHHQETFRCSR